MLSTNYFQETYAAVPKPADLFKDMGNNSETSKVRNIYNAAKSIFGLNSINMFITQDKKIYKFSIIANNKKYELGSIIYIPKDRRLDIWEITNPSLPLLQFQGKRIMFKNYTEFMDKLKIDRLFNPLISNL